MVVKRIEPIYGVHNQLQLYALALAAEQGLDPSEYGIPDEVFPWERGEEEYKKGYWVRQGIPEFLRVVVYPVCLQTGGVHGAWGWEFGLANAKTPMASGTEVGVLEAIRVADEAGKRLYVPDEGEVHPF